MTEKENEVIRIRIDKIRNLTDEGQGGGNQWLEAGALALTTLHDTVGGSHPLTTVLETSLKAKDWNGALAASRAVVTLFEQGSLKSPRLAIAHEIEGDLLDIAKAQTQAAENNKDPNQKQLQLAIAAFLTGASLEDSLRRLCDSRNILYDPQRTTISKLQSALFQPSKQIELISSSENKQITAWGDTRNKADHGKFGEITYAEVLTMVIGVRAFIDKHLA
ncbi:MAG: hypothetical protein MUO31_00235 [Thermodesulfovibrionales bacterium]|nr:hypothetical protein [Thermodesulfovibrionales bacterium]